MFVLLVFPSLITDSYFDTRQFRFHGPDGFEADYAGLTNYFKAIRAAFDESAATPTSCASRSTERATTFASRPPDHRREALAATLCHGRLPLSAHSEENARGSLGFRQTRAAGIVRSLAKTNRGSNGERRSSEDVSITGYVEGEPKAIEASHPHEASGLASFSKWPSL